MKALALLALVLLPGCTLLTEHHRFAIAHGFSAYQTAAIYEAAEDWNVYADKPIVITSGTDHVIALVDDPAVGTRYEGMMLDGLYNGDSKSIFIRRGLSDRRVLAVLRHEMGHALGLEHHAPPRVGVMSNPVADDAVISADDLEQCRARDACH